MNLYVSNLPYTLTDEDLQNEFAVFGNISSARLVKDRETGRSRGFGFVEMPVEAEALTAINALNGKDVGGRVLRVIEARPREDRPSRNFGGGGNRGYGGSGGANATSGKAGIATNGLRNRSPHECSRPSPANGGRRPDFYLG